MFSLSDGKLHFSYERDHRSLGWYVVGWFVYLKEDGTEGEIGAEGWVPWEDCDTARAVMAGRVREELLAYPRDNTHIRVLTVS